MTIEWSGDCCEDGEELRGFPAQEGSSSDILHDRVIAVAKYIVENNATVRQTAKEFGISKSTVHKDVTDRLSYISPALAREVRSVLDVNKSERHIRGGQATREKYLGLSHVIMK